MSTLELIVDAHKSYKLWSWTNGSIHYVAHYIRRLHPKNTPADARENIWTVRIGERGSERAPRSNRDENADVGVVKVAFTREAAAALEREAHCYAQLKDVQGVAVPRCLGHFHSKTKGVEMSCLVLEYCVGAPEQMYEPHRKIMAAAYAIHERNLMHGDLIDGRHFVKSGRRMLIVDFTAAVPHQCPHNRGIRGPDGRRCLGVCPELSALARIYGVYNP